MGADRDIVFSPSFGNRPSRLVGRTETLDSLMAGFKSRPGSKDRAVVLLGQRGFGKTVLLWELADRARQEGMIVASPTSVREGMVERVVEKVAEDANRVFPKASARITGGSVGAFGFSAGIQLERDLRSPSPEARLTSLCRELSREGKELLVLIDELQPNDAEVRRLAATFQELVGEGLDVAIVLAGVPSSVSSVLNDKVLTFLNRARKESLGALSNGDVDAFLHDGLDACGVTVSPAQRRRAVDAIQGAPYLMQLAGHYVVEYSNEDGTVEEAMLEQALVTAREEYEQDVCATVLAPLSRRDREYLAAMASLGVPCSTEKVAKMMGVTTDYAQRYRRRLLDAGIIAASAWGEVEFAVPMLEGYLRKQ